MFQRGLEGLSTLDTSYVSSVSWYFLVMFGLRGFFRLAIGTPKLETIHGQQLWAELGYKAGGGAPAAAPGANEDEAMIKQMNQEAENLPIVLPNHFKRRLDGVVKRLLKNNYRCWEVNHRLYWNITTTFPTDPLLGLVLNLSFKVSSLRVLPMNQTLY